MTRKTKIVATVGPASESFGALKKLAQAGADVFRFNMKQANPEWHEEKIKLAQKAADASGRSIGILMDLQGPEIRLATLNGQKIELKDGQEIIFGNDFFDPKILAAIPRPEAFEAISIGDKLLIAGGFSELKVISRDKKTINAVSIGNSTLADKKSLNVPGKKFSIPSLVVSDLENLDLASRAKVDFVALSFVRDKSDIEILRKELEKRQIQAKIIAKIENRQALENLEELLEASDAVMVARGDLGVEIPLEELAFWQKHIITRAREAAKPVITATQMLLSMVENPRPTRAEVVDAANSVFDGTDAVMLSEETAIGKYPERSVAQMAEILKFNETKALVPELKEKSKNVNCLVCKAAIEMAKDLNIGIKAIIILTEDGNSARIISSFRPSIPVFALSPKTKTAEELSLSYGVRGVSKGKRPGKNIRQVIGNELKFLKENKIAGEGDHILVVCGQSCNIAGLCNSLSVITI